MNGCFMFHTPLSSSIFPSKHIYKLLCTTSQRLYSAHRTDFTVYKIFGIQNNPAAFVQIGFATLTATLDLYFSHMTLPVFLVIYTFSRLCLHVCYTSNYSYTYYRFTTDSIRQLLYPLHSLSMRAVFYSTLFSALLTISFTARQLSYVKRDIAYLEGFMSAVLQFICLSHRNNFMLNFRRSHFWKGGTNRTLYSIYNLHCYFFICNITS